MNKTVLTIAATTLVLLSLQAAALYANKYVSVTPLIKASASWDGATIAYPAGSAELSAMIVELAPGGETGWHLHTAPSLAIMLDGEIEVHLKDGRIKPFKTGEAIVEVVNTLHNGKNTGDKPARMAVFYAGATGAQLTLTEADTLLKQL